MSEAQPIPQVQSTPASNKLFWIIGLITMITIAINGQIMIPLGLIILWIGVLINKKYQTLVKQNTKKVSIAVITGLILWFGGMWLIFNVIQTPDKSGIDFNLQLLPSRLINPMVGLFVDQDQLIQEGRTKALQTLNDSQFSWCRLVAENLIIWYNQKDFVAVNQMIYSETGVDPTEKAQLQQYIIDMREGGWSFSGAILDWRNGSTGEPKTAKVLYVGSFETLWKDQFIQIDCVFNTTAQTWEWYNITHKI